MDCFKLKTGPHQIHLITQEYLSFTQKGPPHYAQDVKEEEHFYAVCPECENPIQIIGLFKNTIEAGRKPYGRHHKGDIPGLSKYSEQDYLDCPYSSPNWKKPLEKRRPGSRISKEVLRLMYEQFDRVIYVLSKDIEVKISKPMAGQMLKHFMNHKAWLYRMASLNNLPWVLGETLPATSLYGQWILRDGELRNVIAAQCSAALFGETISPLYVQLRQQPGEYLNIQFFFFNHKKELDIDGEHLFESIDFEVTSGTKSIYRKTIQIRTDYFLNLINLPEEKAQRNKEYLDIAQDLIDPALFK